MRPSWGGEAWCLLTHHPLQDVSVLLDTPAVLNFSRIVHDVNVLKTGAKRDIFPREIRKFAEKLGFP